MQTTYLESYEIIKVSGKSDMQSMLIYFYQLLLLLYNLDVQESYLHTSIFQQHKKIERIKQLQNIS